MNFVLATLSENLLAPSHSYTLRSSRLNYSLRCGFIFSSVVFASCIVSLHTHLPIYCTINTIAYQYYYHYDLISKVYDYVK